MLLNLIAFGAFCAVSSSQEGTHTRFLYHLSQQLVVRALQAHLEEVQLNY
ncbi:hypothetical protein [Synechococcus sp. LTW-R]|nr:hypothetical protein [Synechococcus sp. LTW-R]QNG29298.1 hypothetical protein H0O22_11320 [Synechococcus sp. LTW-R]